MPTNNATNNYQTAANNLVNYNGVTQTIRFSANVSSVTYTNFGRYIVNFNGSLANANYVTIVTASDSAGVYESGPFINTDPPSPGPSVSQVPVALAGFNFYDADYFITAVFVP